MALSLDNNFFQLFLITVFFVLSSSSPRLISGEFYAVDGDLIIGVILPFHTADDAKSSQDIFYTNGTTCTGRLSYPRAFLAEQFRRLVDTVNANSSILGGYKLGYEIADSCSSPSVAAAQAAKWVANKVRLQEQNFSTNANVKPMPFVIGGYKSDIAVPLATVLQQVNIPLIDFTSTSAQLSDRTAFPLYARTTPSDTYQATAIATLVFHHLMWNCTHLIYSSGVYGETGAAALRREMDKLGICRASDIRAPNTSQALIQALVSIASKPTSAIVCFCDDVTINNLLIALRDMPDQQTLLRVRKQFIVVASDSWGTSLPLANVDTSANGAMTLKVGVEDVPDFADWASQNFQSLIDPKRMDPWMSEFVQDKFKVAEKDIPNRRTGLSLASSDVPKDDSLDLLTMAFYVGVYSLKLLLEKNCAAGSTPLSIRCAPNYVRLVEDGRKLYSYFSNSTALIPLSPDRKTKFVFDQNMDGPPYYNYFIYSSETRKYTNFAYWNLDDRFAPLVDTPYTVIGQNWPGTNTPIPGTCAPIGNNNPATCPAAFYYDINNVRNDTNWSIPCAYYCRENRVTPVCRLPSTVTASSPMTTTPYYNANSASSTAADTSSGKTITALAVIIAVVACAFVAVLIVLIVVICRCRRLKVKVKQLSTPAIKVLAPSEIASEKSFNHYNVSLQGGNRNGAYATMFPGSTTSSLTYSRRGDLVNINDLQPTLIERSLQDELYLVPASKSASQISHTARIRRIILALGGNEEYVRMVETFFVPNDQLIWGEAFADGKFAFVYHGTLRKPMAAEDPQQTATTTTEKMQELPVAVKVLKSRDSEDLLDFLKEAMLMQTFHHPNVMELFGVSLLFDQPHIIVPLMSNGSLRDFVRQYFSSLTSERLLNFCLQISIGMEYLSRNKFIHRDLAARNVLVDSEGLLKIADFGMSRHLQQSDYYKPATLDRPLPIRWHPPESLQMRTFDERSDVWSFGVVVWEIYSGGMQPYGGLTNNEVIDFIAAGNRLSKPDRCSDDMYNNVMLKCWKTAISERPSFAQIIETLGVIAANEQNEKQDVVGSTV